MKEGYKSTKADMERFELLKAMNTIISMMNDEGAYFEWIYTIPDCATDEELMEISIDADEDYGTEFDIFAEAVKEFSRIIRTYGGGGIYCDHSDKVYSLTEDEEES